MKLAGSSKSLEAVARQMGRSEESVAKMARRLGLSLKSKNLGSNNGLTLAPIRGFRRHIVI